MTLSPSTRADTGNSIEYRVVNDRGITACTFNDPCSAEVYADCECPRRGALTVVEVITTVEMRSLHRADPEAVQ